MKGLSGRLGTVVRVRVGGRRRHRRVRLIGNAAVHDVSPVTWEQTQCLHDQLTGMDLGRLPAVPSGTTSTGAPLVAARTA